MAVVNIINDPFAKLCVPDISKNMNVKVFNLISDGMTINADVNPKNWLTKEYVIKD